VGVWYYVHGVDMVGCKGTGRREGEIILKKRNKVVFFITIVVYLQL
jgi:hypothetical protein